MHKLKAFLHSVKDCILDRVCLTLLLIPGFANWVEEHPKEIQLDESEGFWHEEIK